MVGSIFGMLLLATALSWFGFRRLLRYMRYLQQEEYDARRYVLWLRERRAFDRRGSIAIGVILGLELLWNSAGGAGGFFLMAAGAAVLAVIASSEPDPRNSGKLRLRMTERATRTYQVCLGLLMAAVVLAYLTARLLPWPLTIFLLLAIAISQALPFVPAVAARLLAPFEQRLQAALLREAHDHFLAVKPYTVGITGSFGKTSTKSILGQVMNVALGSTFWPSKSVNTLMGITREIRTRLTQGHRFAVIEMGAYYRGSIKKLTELTPPDAAIVTAVGTMHLERFGSAENVFLAKSELPAAVPAEGLLVCNGDNPGARRMAKEQPKATTFLYGMDLGPGDLDCYATDVAFSPKGSEFTIHWKGAAYRAHSPLLGRPAISNMLAAFTMACALGAQPRLVIAALANLEPVDNRLVLKKRGGVSFLQDAYNSNPTGFRAALEVLASYPAKRRILMTPGMIELGETQAQENRAVAAEAAKVCDFVIVVAETNRASFEAGLAQGGLSNEKWEAIGTRTAAFEKLESMLQDGDVVLIENDLPDKLEFTERF